MRHQRVGHRHLHARRGVYAVAAAILVAASCSVPSNPETTSPPEEDVDDAAPSGVTTVVETQPAFVGTDSLPTTPAPARIAADVVVVGDGLGGVGAAVQAGRMGVDVTLISPFGYPGGQAGSAAVTSFDDASGPARDLFRASGLYAELYETIEAHYSALNLSTSRCYFSNVNTFCPEPHVVRDTLEAMLDDAGVKVIVDDATGLVFDEEGAVAGATTADHGDVTGLVIDATEFGDLIPAAGATHEIGSRPGKRCVQHMTHAVVMAWYPVVPDEIAVPEGARHAVAQAVGPETVEMWLEEFRAGVARGGQTEFTGWADLAFPVDPALAAWYRGMPDSRDQTDPDQPEVSVSGINLPNDVELSVEAIEDAAHRVDALRIATLKSYLYMWYDRWELGRDHWAVAAHLEFEDARRIAWFDEVPDPIERHMPPGYYVREARRLTGSRIMSGADTMSRGVDIYPDSVFIGGDRSDDDHGDCPIDPALVNPTLGPYDAPLSVFIPDDVNGFLVGVARNGNVDRSVASSIRMHAPELLGGQAVGALAALAVERGVAARDVPVVDVRRVLVEAGAIIDVP